MVESPPLARNGDTVRGDAASLADGRFIDHLASAADMVGARRFREAEVEVLRGLSIAPSDLRALKLLALVRFKLGRLEEARAVCREIAATLPRDAGIRLKLGLIALKLDRVDESVHELEMSARLAPDDMRVWSYLGFAYARRGERTRAATAFRRAGQEEHAQEAERGAITGPGSARGQESEPASRAEGADKGGSGPVGGDPPVGHGQRRVASAVPPVEPVEPVEPGLLHALSAPREPRTDPDQVLLAPRTGAGTVPVAPLVGFAVSRLAPASDQASWVGATARLAVGAEVDVFVRQDAAVACTGAVSWADAHRHVRGRATAIRLGKDVPGGTFVRVHGSGDVFVAAPAGHLVPLALQDDTLYLREDRVLAFQGALAWESGAIPRAGLRMLQFRGRGLVALAVTGQPGAVKVTPDRPVFVSPSALLGWVGSIVALGGGGQPDAPAPGAPAGPFAITCEGEGVVLMDVAPGSDKERP